MPAVKGGSYGGVSAAERKEDRRQRLLAAGLEVIGTKGWADATVRAICAQSGLSSRFFYESFGSVEELAVALLDDIFERTTAAVAAAVSAAPRQARTRNRVAIETFVRALTDDRRVARLVFMEALGNEALSRRRLGVVHSAVEAVLTQVGTHAPPGVGRKYRQIVATVLIGGLAELLIGWMHGQIDVDLEQLISDYVQLVHDVGDATYGKARSRTARVAIASDLCRTDPDHPLQIQWRPSNMPQFHHVNLGVPVGGQDAEESFLVGLLGYRRVSPGPELEGLVRWFEGDDGVQVHLSEDPEHRPPARAHVAIDFGGELPAIEAKLAAQGVACDALEDRGVRLVFCQDPAGNRWELRGPVSAIP